MNNVHAVNASYTHLWPIGQTKLAGYRAWWAYSPADRTPLIWLSVRSASSYGIRSHPTRPGVLARHAPIPVHADHLPAVLPDARYGREYAPPFPMLSPHSPVDPAIMIRLHYTSVIHRR